MGNLKLSPLDARHRALSAHMGSFAGWDMPISYEGTIAEHTAVRTAAGVFDVSHLGKFLAVGADPRADLDEALTNRIADLPVGQARYSLILNDRAGIIDDLIVYVLDEDRVLVVPNAANVDTVRGAVAAAGTKAEPLDWATLALQGPASKRILHAVFPSVHELAYLEVAEIQDGIVIARTGYTGEHGYEIFSPPDGAPAIWDAVVAEGAVPAGLAARDTLRLEMGYPLHGSDIDQDTTPREAGLGWAVGKSKATYLGKEAYESSGPSKQLCGIRMIDKVIPRHGAKVLLGSREIGAVTSGTFSPTLRIGIALAYVEPGSVAEGDNVEIEVRSKKGAGTVQKPPFVASDPRAE